MPKKQANAVDAHVGNQVRLRRMLIGMSQEKLGQLLGLTFQQVQKYERGINRIGAGRLFEIAHVLGVNIRYFYDGLGDTSSGRLHGVSDEAEPPQLVHFATSGEGLQLNMAFMRITDHKVRKRILDLVKSLADDDEAAKKAKAGSKV